MSIAAKIPLRKLNPSLIKELQEKYPEAELHVVVSDKPLHSDGMSEQQFWDIIGKLDWRQEEDEAIMAPAVKALSQYSEKEIHEFSEILAEKLYALDGRRFAEQLGGDSWTEDGSKHFSVDLFLYARCCVVANGKETYEQVLHDPARMPKGYTFESLLYLANDAWKLKTGQYNYSHIPEVWYETFSNLDGWPGITPLKDRILDSNG